MTNTWQKAIQQQQTTTPDFNTVESPSFAPLSQLGVLTVSGEDAQSFLQNLLTNDVAALEINQSQLTGFCNAKGRLFALFLLIRHKQHYQIVLPRSMVNILQQRLLMYVLRSKVTLSDDTDQLALFSIANAQQSNLALLRLSEDDYQLLTNNQCLCIISMDKTDQLLDTIDKLNWPLTSERVWDIAAIEAGLPMVFPETKEKFTPQQVNFDLVNGVSFKKGCYPGQEIVARLHYLGTPSRRMFLAQIKSSKSPNIGDEVITDSGDTAGHIVYAEISSNNVIKLLVSLKLSDIEKSLHTTDSADIIILKTELPEQA
jgi:folate-binding protein YgfZ